MASLFDNALQAVNSRLPANPLATPTPNPLAPQSPLDVNALKDIISENSELLREEDPDELARKSDMVYNRLRMLALTRAQEIRQPTPSQRTLMPIPEEQVALAKMREASRLKYVMSSIDRAQGLEKTIYSLARQNPEIARDAGISPDWFARTWDIASSNAHKGYRFLDILLRNLDRGRGALVAASLSYTQGGTAADARRKAWDAFRGSSKGFVFAPAAQAPSFREVLVAAGLDDDVVAKSLGFTLDLLIDPINVISFGATRAAMLGAHQYLNTAGRAVHGKLVRAMLDEAIATHRVANEAALPEAALRTAFTRADTEMRHIINSDFDTARQFLDLGGLKFGEMSFGVGLTKERKIYPGGGGRPELAIVPRSYLRLGARKVGERLERTGVAWEGDVTASALKQRLGTFMHGLPAHLRQAGENVGLLFSRTNPAAGDDFKIFKQVHYYDRLGWEQSKVEDAVVDTFKGLAPDDLHKATFAIERGTVPQFIAELESNKGALYAQQMQTAIARYHNELDASLVDEIQRGFFGRGMPPTERRLLAEWVKNPAIEGMLDPKMLERFKKIRRDNYVTHYYHDYQRFLKTFPRQSKPTAPSITEPFSHRRTIQTLDEAMAAGFRPETNLAKLMAIRLGAARRAISTYDFLLETGKEFGQNVSDIVEAANKRIVKLGEPKTAAGRRRKQIAETALHELGLVAGDLTYEPMWRQLDKLGRTASGGIPLGTAKQKEMARELAQDRNVPVEIVARLDDAAKAEFIEERLRLATTGRIKAQWRRYVEEPTKNGLYDGYAVAPGKTLTEATANARGLHDPFYQQWTQFTPGGLADPRVMSKIYLPTAIVKDLERLKQTAFFPPEMRTFAKLWLGHQFWWKRSVTVIWPAFHVRNKITNVLNSGMDIGIAGLLDRKPMWEIIQGGDGYFKTETGVTYSYSQLREAMRRYGIIRSEYKRTDITEQLQDLVEEQLSTIGTQARERGLALPGGEARLGPKYIPAPTAPFQTGRAVALVLENSDRAQHFLMTVKRGASFEKAAKRTNDFLFDYEDISNIERRVVRNMMFPFWTWTRKNLALQGRVAIRTPGRFVTFGKFSRAFSDEKDSALRSDVEKELLPRLLEETLAIRTEAASKWATYLMNIDLPQEDLNKLWDLNARDTAMRKWVAQLHPITRSLMEWAVQMNFFTGRSTADLPMQDQRVVDAFASAPQSLKDFLGFRKKYVRDQIIYSIDAGKFKTLMAATAWTATRFYSQVGRFLDPNTKMTEKLFNYLTGMRFKYLRPAEEARTLMERVITDPSSGITEQYANMERQLLAAKQAQQMSMSPPEEQMSDVEKQLWLQQLEHAVNIPETEAEAEAMHDLE